MQNSEGKGQNPAPPEASGDGEKTPEVGPLGRTRSEDQRRRLIVAGLSAPTLMTLPSRRVWATECSKSKLMSGNLSAKNNSQPIDCEPMGCGRKFWTSPEGRDFGQDAGEPAWTGMSFNSIFPGNVESVFTPDTLELVVSASDGDWDKILKASAKADFGTDYKDDAAKELIKAARELAAAVLNETYITWPVPNDQFNFNRNIDYPGGPSATPYAGLQGLWSLGGLPPTQEPVDALAASSQIRTAIYDNARDAGHWAERREFYKAIEEDKNNSSDDRKEAEAQRKAAEDLYEDAKDQVKSFIDDNNYPNQLKPLNEKYCPLA